MKKVLLCLVVLISTLISYARPSKQDYKQHLLIGLWNLTEVNSQNTDKYESSGIWKFYESGELAITGADLKERPNGVWNGTWHMDHGKPMLHINENNGQHYNVGYYENWLIKELTPSVLVLFTGSTNDYWQELTFTRQIPMSDSDMLLCAHRWRLTKRTLTQHRWSNGRPLADKKLREDKIGSEPWLMFYPDHTATESGVFFSTCKQLQWQSVKDGIIIQGENLYADEIVSNTLKFQIEAVTSDYCRMTCLLTPETHDGAYITYTLEFCK